MSEIPRDAAPAPRLALYAFEGCPYCERVMRAARSLGVELEWRDIETSAEHRAALLAARGRTTVPVLRISRPGAPDDWMPESEDIVRALPILTGRRASGPWPHRWLRALGLGR